MPFIKEINTFVYFEFLHGHIQHINVLDEKTLLKPLKRMTGEKTWSGMKKHLVLSKHAPLFTEKRCRTRNFSRCDTLRPCNKEYIGQNFYCS